MKQKNIINNIVLIATLFFALFNSGVGEASYSAEFNDDGISQIVLDGRTNHIVGMHMDVLEDKNTTLSINAVTSAEHSGNFHPFRKQFANWGFTTSAYWYRTVIVNPSDEPQDLILEQTTSWIDSIKLYTSGSESGQEFSVVHVGDRLPFNQRPIKHHDFLLPITVEAGESLPIYIRIESRAAVITPLVLWERDAFSHHDSSIAYYFGAFLGILAIMFVYNLFLFLTLKDSNYLYYIIFILSVTMVFATSKGLTFMYLWPDDPGFIERVQTAGLSFFQLGGILFAKNFFDTNSKLPRFNVLFLFLIVVHSLIIFLASIVEDVIPLANISLGMVQLNAVILLATGLQAWRKGNRTARYYLAAWSLSVIGVVITALTLLGVLNYNFFLYNATFIGALLDVAFLSFALADRINLLRSEKDHARQLVHKTLRKTKNELESKVATRTADLRAAKETADHASSVKSEFLSNMSHELRTPLNSILGFAQLLESDRTPSLSQTQQENVEHIISSGSHLLCLITDILDFSRIEAGKLTVSMESISLRDILDDTLQLTASLADEHSVTLRDKTPASDFCFVNADATRLTQVIINILTNAIKYNKRGGKVFLDSVISNGEVEINIRDTGQGISGDKINKVFQPFERIDADKKGIEGTGIGLAITKHLITLMNGSIGVSSSLGKGSTFTLKLALCDSLPVYTDKSPFSETSEELTFPTEQHKILYVEDNILNQKLMHHIFSRHENIELIIADCGLKGIEIAKTSKPSMIIMDIRLPDISGFRALKLLRSMKETESIPVIAVSANATVEDLEKGLNAGFIDYIEKPVDIPKLMSAVAHRLQR
ncbi:MAG: 7TM diverse intracellular signaling domain-containing protein [Sedimenticola sp.]